jgi:DNA topoisomerase-1
MNILIVESKPKCKTIQKHLGEEDWRVLSTGGHVEALPSKEQRGQEGFDPKQAKKAYWQGRGDELPEPPWVWTERGAAAIEAIREEAAQHDEVVFYLASDPDREGERIAWHLEKLLCDMGPCHRVTFQEVTKKAILTAVQSPGAVDQGLVDAALVRMFLDRIVGWRTGKIAPRYTKGKGAMGRVQTPTLGFVVERELEREAHVPVAYFEVRAATALTDWKVRFHEKDDPLAWRDDKGRFDARRTSEASLAEQAWEAVGAAGALSIEKVTRRERSQSPNPPFRTDTLMQAAGSGFGWSPGKTTKLAGDLYNAGHLTYIRTDSTRMSPEAVAAGKGVVTGHWGERFLAPKPASDAPAAGVQDAHEAIRPTDMAREEVPGVDDDHQKLYALVRARALAALMVPSVRVSLSLVAKAAALDLQLEGTVGWYSEPGWRLAFDAVQSPVDTTAVDVEVGQVESLSPPEEEHPNPELIEDVTKPPGRYRAPAIIQLMKKNGIGRPSTYGKTIEKLVGHRYLSEEDGSLSPTTEGRNIWLRAAPLYTLEDGDPLFDASYTAEMESLLDAVAEGHAPAGPTWLKFRDAIRDAHERAKLARDQGALVPSTRQRLLDYMSVAPGVAEEVGDLDGLTEEQGKECLKDLKDRGLVLLPSQAQTNLVERKLTSTGLSLEQATDAAGLLLSSPPSRKEISELIDFLLEQPTLDRPPSAKQLRWIADLAKKKGLDEQAACALVDCTDYEKLTGGKQGTASRLIDALRGGDGVK